MPKGKLQPMLAVAAKGPLTFPLIASPKLDGIRAWSPDEADGVVSRQMKRFPNSGIYDKFEDALRNLDGEFCVGPVTAPDVFRKTGSVVMSQTADARDLVFWVFDEISDLEASAEDRLRKAEARVRELDREDIRLVEQVVVHSEEELRALEEKWLLEGYEGAMVRAFGSPYKLGRSTEKEGYLLKIKRFLDSEAIIIGVEELDHNNNEATISETGHTKRSSKKDGLVGAGTLGALIVQDVVTNIEFKIGTGFDADERQRLWNAGPDILGMAVKYKYFPTGSKEKPRFPVYLGIRILAID